MENEVVGSTSINISWSQLGGNGVYGWFSSIHMTFVHFSEEKTLQAKEAKKLVTVSSGAWLNIVMILQKQYFKSSAHKKNFFS